MSEDTPPAPAAILVVFGASGDLTRRLLAPALANLRRSGLLSDAFDVVGVARADWNDEAFREHLARGDGRTGDEWTWLAQRAEFSAGDFSDPEIYRDLARRIERKRDARDGEPNVLFYLATPPDAFTTIVANLGRAHLLREGADHWRRVVIEKPFGRDLKSARELNAALSDHLAESQIFRIDHYLGKEIVQNVMVFRFGNGIFEPLWNRNHIDHVQITVAESIGVEKRGPFYDPVGALRDMVPNHLFQLLELVAMEPPVRFEGEAVRAERARLLRSVRPLSPADGARDVVRGQYAEGWSDGLPMVAYRDTDGVARDSNTETYVALKLAVDSWRWVGVPFYLRTGKALKQRRSEIAVRFKQAPPALFRDTPARALAPNDLVIHVGPAEGISLGLQAKKPGPRIEVGRVEMRFDYARHFRTPRTNGYETLLYDCMVGDRMLFKQAEEIEAGWRIVESVVEGEGPAWLGEYAAGSDGPPGAGELLSRDGREWRPLDD